jgi:hypothetical protein
LIASDTATPTAVVAPRASAPDRPLALLDVQRDDSRLAREGVASLRLLWLARQAPTTGYRAAIAVVAADGTVHRAPWVYEPLSRLWERGEIVPTTVAIRLPAAFPPGPADLRLVFDRPDEMAPLALGSMDVPATAGPPPVAEPAGEIAIGQSLRLGPSEQVPPPTSAAAGGPLDLAVRWRAVAGPPDVDRELLTVAVLAVPGREIVSEVRRPGDWFAPLPFWQAGDTVEQRIRLGVPPTVPAGEYPLRVRVYGRDLARGGISEPGASEARVRGQPLAELALGTVQVLP